METHKHPQVFRSGMNHRLLRYSVSLTLLECGLLGRGAHTHTCQWHSLVIMSRRSNLGISILRTHKKQSSDSFSLWNVAWYWSTVHLSINLPQATHNTVPQEWKLTNNLKQFLWHTLMYIIGCTFDGSRIVTVSYYLKNTR